MYKFIRIEGFAKTLFDNDDEAKKASQIADAIPDNYEANYKMI